MRIVPVLAAGVALCVLGGASASASPAPLPGRVGSDIEWHPSTRHWDHHFHAHQHTRATPYLAEADGYGREPLRYGRPSARRPAWTGAGPGAQRN